MPQLKVKELRNLTADELKEKLGALKKELFSLRVQAKLGKLEKHTSIKITKKHVARVNTLLREKESS
ncbi:MAG: 50S ribosomal protein L29 [Candidatus Omnitrophica bacterium]|nr:50S ribosomal protein L29 [Candidatus Omnitrophota bacterium]